MRPPALHIAILTATALLMPLLSACRADEKNAYSHFEEIPDDGWDPVDILIFEPWPRDSAQAYVRTYSMDLVLRYSTRRHISMLPVAMAIENADGELRSDTLLLHPDSLSRGMTGRVKYGVHEVTLNLDSAVTLTEGYSVSLLPLSPRGNTSGLLNVGIILR